MGRWNIFWGIRLFFIVLLAGAMAAGMAGCGKGTGGKRIVRVALGQSESHPEYLGLVAFKEYVEDNGVVIAVCGGYQLLGHYYDTDDGRIEGLSLVDLYTEQGTPRLISNIVIQNDLFPYPIVGFENHGGRTFIGDNKPLGKVLFGYGNNETEKAEGVLYKNVIGTYLHGPLLPKNPHICDYLIKNALERKYGTSDLSPLDDEQELQANRYIVERFVK